MKEISEKNEDMLINGNSVDLDEVLKFAGQAVSQAKAEQADAKMERVKSIVEGVARKYASKWLERDDLEQDLWVSTLELINNCGGIENADLPLIAKSCYNKAVDLYRYHRKRYESKTQLIDETESDDEQFSSASVDQSKYSVAKTPTGFDEAVLREVIDLFPKGSRQRKYVIAKLYFYGEIDEGFSGLDKDDELKLPETGDNESDFVQMIGFNSRYPGSWGAMKYGIRETIYKYLGLMPETYESNPKLMLACIRDRVETIFSESKSGYINLDKLAKDKILKLMHADPDKIWSSVKLSKKLLRGYTKSGQKFVMKNQDKYLKNSKKNNDRILSSSEE